MKIYNKCSKYLGAVHILRNHRGGGSPMLTKYYGGGGSADDYVIFLKNAPQARKKIWLSFFDYFRWKNFIIALTSFPFSKFSHQFFSDIPLFNFFQNSYRIIEFWREKNAPQARKFFGGSFLSAFLRQSFSLQDFSNYSESHTRYFGFSKYYVIMGGGVLAGYAVKKCLTLCP